ncbi:MAG: polyphosphate polymerase domain-containing protein [Prevotellaceae bacterium]|nr:polyphosphate polymerase domain-containing protein [Prevotellaceae bacterium]
MTDSPQNDRAIRENVEQLLPISLEEMSEIRLMNRTDMKYVSNKTRLAELLELARGKYYAQFHEGDYIAPYMTTYWDTADYLFYMEHHNGRSPRQKVRVRTYVDSDLTFLEVKTKNNHGRTGKKRIQVPGQEELESGNDFLVKLVNHGLSDIHPTIRNRFSRITLVNYEKTERLTVDFDIRFNNLETDRRTGTGELVVIELKRDGNSYSPVLDILRQLRIKPLGFSKYCIGSVMTNPGLKHNEFKPKLVEIDRLVNRAY